MSGQQNWSQIFGFQVKPIITFILSLSHQIKPFPVLKIVFFPKQFSSCWLSFQLRRMMVRINQCNYSSSHTSIFIRALFFWRRLTIQMINHSMAWKSNKSEAAARLAERRKWPKFQRKWLKPSQHEAIFTKLNDGRLANAEVFLWLVRLGRFAEFWTSFWLMKPPSFTDNHH